MMKQALEKLNAEQIGFICHECSITKEHLMTMDEYTLYDEVYEKMCEIEIDETFDRDEEDTKRGSMAADIVTILGNTLE